MAVNEVRHGHPGHVLCSEAKRDSLYFDSDRCRDMIGTAIEHAESARRAVGRVLTWAANLPMDERDRYTRAANALEIACCRLRNVFGDCKPIAELL